MIKLENTEVIGWDAAIRGMRNPMNSWKKSDSLWRLQGSGPCGTKEISVKFSPDSRYIYNLGENDQNLMMKLRNAGNDHRKFMRMIVVYVDVTAPLYWWKESDTYKVGTVANSCSTMHKIADREFTLEDFSTEHLDERDSLNLIQNTISLLNSYRALYNERRDKHFWWQMIQCLPSSYNQKRTLMLNYEVLANIYRSRKNHKLDEWREFCKWIENLPYSELITSAQEK